MLTPDVASRPIVAAIVLAGTLLSDELESLLDGLSGSLVLEDFSRTIVSTDTLLEVMLATAASIPISYVRLFPGVEPVLAVMSVFDVGLVIDEPTMVFTTCNDRLDIECTLASVVMLFVKLVLADIPSPVNMILVVLGM